MERYEIGGATIQPCRSELHPVPGPDTEHPLPGAELRRIGLRPLPGFDIRKYACQGIEYQEGVEETSARKVCPSCAKTFRRPADLSRHQVTMHGDTVYWCPIAGCKRGHQQSVQTTPERGTGSFKRIDKRNKHVRDCHPNFTGDLAAFDAEMLD
jgi:hypothetical protein